MEKKCNRCKEIKSTNNFYIEGRGRGDGFRAICKPCSNTDIEKERAKLWRSKNPKKLTKQKAIEKNKLVKLGDLYIKRSIRAALTRAKSKGYTNYDTKEALFKHLKSIGGVPEKCPILGIRLEYGGGSASCSPSLDRIDVRKGYVVGNLWYISARANMMKNNASFKELQKFSKYFLTNFNSWGRKRNKQSKR